MGQTMCNFLSKKDIRKSFKTAAEDGNAYLLLLTDTLDVFRFHCRITYMMPVADASEIVPLLHKEQARHPNSIVSLSGIYNLSEKFKEQYSVLERDKIRKLPAPVRMDLLDYHDGANTLAKYYEEKKKLAGEQDEWSRRPWYERLFTAKPH